MLVAFAGKDPDEPPLETPETKYLRRKSHTRPEKAYRLFLGGHDTAYIALRFRRVTSESTVLRWITLERCKRKGLPSPYGAKS